MVGLDNAYIEQMDYKLSIKRISKDIDSDFIYAPHLNVIYKNVSTQLWDNLNKKLKNGSFEPGLPIIIEVPKSSGFSRPGAILWPYDRLAYQAVVDCIAPKAEMALGRSQVFSYVLERNDKNGFMFKPANECFEKFRNAIISNCRSNKYSYVLKADVSSYFERLYQHVLCNTLKSTGCDNNIVNLLEKLLASFTQKDSHGIVQGLYPSDFLGNYYLSTIDARHKISRIPSIRYVDDLYIFFKKKRHADFHKITLSSWLRPDGLNLNESKTKVFNINELLNEETEVDSLFQNAKDEVYSEFQRIDIYSSTLGWDSTESIDSIDEKTIELMATKKLFDALTDAHLSEGTKSKIEKFCLPVFTAVKDEYAIEYVLSNYITKMHMAQIYSKYLKTFMENKTVRERVEDLLRNSEILYEYQMMWAYAILMVAATVRERTIADSLKRLRNRNIHETVRAICAQIVGKFGNASQRRILKELYHTEPSIYVKASILYAAQYFPKNEKETCFAAWCGHNDYNSLIVAAIKS